MTRRLRFQQLLHRGVQEGATPFLRLLHFTLNPYLIMLSVKQGGIKCHFFESLVWLDLGSNPSFLDRWRTRYSFGKCGTQLLVPCYQGLLLPSLLWLKLSATCDQFFLLLERGFHNTFIKRKKRTLQSPMKKKNSNIQNSLLFVF